MGQRGQSKSREIRRNCLRSGRSRSLYLSIRRVIKQILLVIGAYQLC